MSETRYRLEYDESGHRYVIPVDREDEWDAWHELPSSDPRSWEVPDFAKRVEGDLTFTNPRCE